MDGLREEIKELRDVVMPDRGSDKPNAGGRQSKSSKRVFPRRK